MDVLFQNFKKLIENLDSIPEVQECYKVTGKHSVILKIAVTDNAELENVIDKISLYGQPQTSIVLSSYINKPHLKLK